MRSLFPLFHQSIQSTFINFGVFSQSTHILHNRLQHFVYTCITACSFYFTQEISGFFIRSSLEISPLFIFSSKRPLTVFIKFFILLGFSLNFLPYFEDLDFHTNYFLKFISNFFLQVLWLIFQFYHQTTFQMVL